MDEILGASDEAPAETSPAPVPATDHSGILPVEALAANADERIRLQSLFEQYKTCREVLTPLQWTATCLRFRDGLSETEIAFRLGKSRSAVHGLLKRARTRKEEFRSRLREEAFLMARKHLNP